MQFAKNEMRAISASRAPAIRQSKVHHWGRALACFAALAILACVAEPGQLTPPGMLAKQELPEKQVNQLPDVNQQMKAQEQQAKQQNFAAANAERKKQIAEDSAKLLKLATELKTEVDKTTKDTLSLGVIRKADEIEKLAHNVKEKMKLTVGGS
jgi:uncharacterized membrane protein YdfJ with MMPL/SSD domain